MGPRTFDFKNATNEEITKHIQNLVDNSYEQGKSDGAEIQTAERSYITEGVLSGDKKNISDPMDLVKVGTELNQVIQDFGAAANPENFKGADFLRDAAQDMANSLGLGKARMSEMKTTIADALPEMLRLGITEKEALNAMEDIPKTLGINTSLGKEALVEMTAAANITGVSVGKLATDFKGVGISLYDVGDKMAEVANYAKSVGTNVKAVSGEVVANLKQLNLYNFDTGVKGLAKMAAQASMLGIDMENTFNLAEDLMSPESAIDLSAALQRLGVSSSALLDPLKAMDLAQNDPEALQQEMINVSKEFTKLKADGSGFEILPGAKRRLREVAEAMGMSATELANMSIKSADLDMKMSKIKFPSLASSEEDKLLIANMAQMKGGEAVLQIKNDKTGKMDDINVKDLTADQITKLKEQQSNENKTIEEIALEQLTALEQINTSLNSGKTAINLGKATTPTMDRFYNVIQNSGAIAATNLTKGITTENIRTGTNEVLGPLEEEVIKFFKGESDWATVTATLTEAKDGLLDIANDLGKGGANVLLKTTTEVMNMFTKEYSSVGVNPTQITFDPNNPVLTQITSFIEQLKTGGVKETKTTVSGNVTHDFNIKGDGVGSLTQTEFNKFFLEAYTDPTIKSKVDAAYGTSNSGLMADKK
jgi:hypothetical protein